MTLKSSHEISTLLFVIQPILGRSTIAASFRKVSFMLGLSDGNDTNEMDFMRHDEQWEA